MSLQLSNSTLPHVLIIGAGFAGIEACRALAEAQVRISIVDRNNYHLFQPLLYQVATAALSPADIAFPIRTIFRDQQNVQVYLSEAQSINLAESTVQFDEETSSFDYLILAAGATHSYFGKDEWRDEAPGLKTVEDATEIRKRILLAFEEAEHEADEKSRRSKLTFVIVGGGPTGVELAGALKEIASETIPLDFRNVDTTTSRIVLIHSGDRLLQAFHEESSAAALQSLQKMGVEVKLNCRVTDVTSAGVMIGDVYVYAQNIFWAAGVQATPLTQTLSGESAQQSFTVALDKSGRVVVQSDLSIPGYPNVFVVGDNAAMIDSRTSSPVPGVAQGAMQSGRFVGEIIASEVECEIPPKRPAFSYFNKGNMATIGKAKAVAEIGPFRFRGFIAWWLWSLVHVAFLIGFRNRTSVLLSWIWNYLVSSRGARLITGAITFDVKVFQRANRYSTKVVKPPRAVM